MSEERARFRRILLKVSGDAFAPTGRGNQAESSTPPREPLDREALEALAGQVLDAHHMGVETALVIGGGNIVRGHNLSDVIGIGRVPADQMGMLATVINGLAIQDVLERRGVETRLMTAIEMSDLAEPFIRRRALRHLQKGRVVILAAGTGNPYFTTDTAAALRAMEIQAEVMLKGTKVDGVYSADPLRDPSAKRFDHLSYDEVLSGDLEVMDATAVTLCRENHLPIIVFNVMESGSLRRLLSGEPVGTLVGDLSRDG